MKIRISNHVFEFDNRVESVENVLETIEEVIRKEQIELLDIIIDGVSVRENYNEYILKNIEGIEEVVILNKGIRTLVGETLESTFEYVNRVVLILEDLSNSFYQGPESSAWNSLADLFEGIQWIMGTQERVDKIYDLDRIISNYESWNQYVLIVRKLKDTIPLLETAMINQDNVLIGDLLIYEVQPIFKASAEKLRFLIPSGGNNCVS